MLCVSLLLVPIWVESDRDDSSISIVGCMAFDTESTSVLSAIVQNDHLLPSVARKLHMFMPSLHLSMD